MMQTIYRLPFRLLGIPIQLDLTFLLVLPLLAWLIGSEIDRLSEAFGLRAVEGRTGGVVASYLIGFLCALGLFLSVLIHELGHSFVGQKFHLKIRSITLWILGGMAQFESIPRRKGTEAVMAMAGPVTSLLVGLVSWILLRATPDGLPALQFVFAYLMFMNWVLAGFNLLPALPLDGGRIFRSLLALKFSFVRATQIAAGVSKILAIFLGLFGLLVQNFWMILLAFFIYIAVTGESQQVTVSMVLRGIRVRDLMTPKVKTVKKEMTIADLVHWMFRDRHLAYPVLESDGRIAGLITLQNIRDFKNAGGNESQSRVADVMNPVSDLILEGRTALEAFQRISRNQSGRLLVVDRAGMLKGIISKTDLIRAIEVRTLEAEFDDDA